MTRGQLHVGTSGWSYKHWMNGVFYPPKLKPAEWLHFYAEHFDTVEINTSFYHLPREAMADRWAAVAPPGFRFAVKLWRLITHRKKLADTREYLDTFLAVMNRLGPHRGPLLVQLPPGLGLDIERLERFLDDLAGAIGAEPWPVAIEFRRGDWVNDEVRALLDHHRAALVIQDMHYCTITEPNDAPFVYIRRHGLDGHYHGLYLPEQIGADAGRIRGWLGEGRDVWVYYNNDLGGAAIQNARQLIDLRP